MADYGNLPDFDSLPPVKGMPQGCAWGIFDKDGKKDHLGCINLLTPVTRGFDRKALVHRVFTFQDHPILNLRMHGFDDEIDFNTQASSQWDSLVHFAHQPSGLNYNGTQASTDLLSQPFGKFDVDRNFSTLNHWHERGGMIGRGVLPDYRAYADSHGIEFKCFESSKIYVEDLEKVAAWEKVELRQGDILIIRTGVTEELSAAKTEEEQQRLLCGQKACGVFGSVGTARWFWNHHFAALPPVKDDGTEDSPGNLVLHQYFLSLFGLNVGELWVLKELSKVCAEKKRFTFMLTSVPLNLPGAVGSPPNALAIF
ncbi:hypothetical protein GQ44DRAFT_744080 [Phaeosphaeriaceae sp. PMI808]|nr:hypothetical protein GQ44DRAFT_744080 [Phaeosphaeriaceae sp. PMI808]